MIVGDGGLARECEWLVHRVNEKESIWNFEGFIDYDTSRSDVIRNDDFLLRYKAEKYVAIAIGDSSIRKRIYNACENNSNIKFANLIDPSVIYSDEVRLGQGNIICSGSILIVNIAIGNFNIINLDCTLGHDAVIDDFVTDNPSVNISRSVHINSGCNIGAGTQIIQDLEIGKNSVIGAGTVVVNDLPGDITAVGVPAKVISVK